MKRIYNKPIIEIVEIEYEQSSLICASAGAIVPDMGFDYEGSGCTCDWQHGNCCCDMNDPFNNPGDCKCNW